jgi:hypothetical protein
LKEIKLISREALFARSAGETSVLQMLQWEWQNSNSTSVKPRESKNLAWIILINTMRSITPGRSDPDVWETHLEFFFSKQTALRRYAEIKRLHAEAAKKTAVRPFFRPTGEIEIHPDMIKDFGSENLDTAKGVWQFEYWLPSTEKQAAKYEDRMSAGDPNGWAEHRQRQKRHMHKPTAES